MEKKVIEFKADEYEVLIKMVFLAETFANLFRVAEPIEKYSELASFIYSKAKDFGFEKFVEIDTYSEQYDASDALIDDEEILQITDDYDEQMFWESLIFRLSQRDLENECGADVVEKMDFSEKLEKQQVYSAKYLKEFEANGLDNLIVK